MSLTISLILALALALVFFLLAIWLQRALVTLVAFAIPMTIIFYQVTANAQNSNLVYIAAGGLAAIELIMFVFQSTRGDLF